MSGISDDEVIRIARLRLAVGSGDQRVDEYEQALKTMESSDWSAMWMAEKLIEGKPYYIRTDNPASVRRARSVAERLGGVVTFFRNDGCMTDIRFDPSPKSSAA